MGYWDDADAMKALRGAVYRGDGSVVEPVRGRLTDDLLQLVGGAVAPMLRPLSVDLEMLASFGARDPLVGGRAHRVTDR